MAFKARKTEHSGAKKGRGAYWGRKVDAKRESNRKRREAAKAIVRDMEKRLGAFWFISTAI
jgi:predicted aminopeptidase